MSKFVNILLKLIVCTVIISILQCCKNDIDDNSWKITENDSTFVDIVNIKNFKQVLVGDTVIIKYNLLRKGVESIYFHINDSIITQNYSDDSIFVYKASKKGISRFHISANFNNNTTISSKEIVINSNYGMFEDNKTIYIRDSVYIKYKFPKDGFKNIRLTVNDSLITSSIYNWEGKCFYFPMKHGLDEIVLEAIYENNRKLTSLKIPVYVCYLKPPSVELNISRIDGEETYFLGEKLFITVKPQWHHVNMGIFKKATMIMNNDTLGTSLVQPFAFTTEKTIELNNKVELYLFDSLNHTHYLPFNIVLEKNTSPEVEFGFKYRHGIRPGYYYSDDDIILSSSIIDNVKISHIDYYLNDSLISSEVINERYKFSLEKKLGNLLPGNYKCRSIVYDDRGDSTNKELDIIVYNAFDINEPIIEIVSVKDKIIVLTKSKLYLYGDEDKVISLPFDTSRSMEVDENGTNVYIGFNNGKIIKINTATEEKNVIVENSSGIWDLRIDSENYALIYITNYDLNVFYINSKESKSASVLFSDGAKVALGNNNTIIAGGNPHSSRSTIYRYQYDSNGLYLRSKDDDIGGFSEGILMRNDKESFVVLMDNYNTGLSEYNSTNFNKVGRFEHFFLEMGCYSENDKLFYSGSNLNNEICVFNTNNYSLGKKIYIPLTDTYTNFGHIITNGDDSQLIIVEDNDDSSKIVIVDL